MKPQRQAQAAEVSVESLHARATPSGSISSPQTRALKLVSHKEAIARALAGRS